MFAQRLTSAARYLWRSLAEGARKVQTLRERYKAIKDVREARGITLLREWLSPMQRAQFDASAGALDFQPGVAAIDGLVDRGRRVDHPPSSH